MKMIAKYITQFVLCCKLMDTRAQYGTAFNLYVPHRALEYDALALV